jgi:hypothetical protein
MALMPAKRMGLPPRSLAADARDCIMVRSRCRIYRIQGRGARSLRSTLWQARLRSSCLCSLLAKRTPPGVNPTRPSLPPCSGRSRSGLEMICAWATLARRPSLTVPLRSAALRAPRVGPDGWAPLRVDQKDRKRRMMTVVELVLDIEVPIQGAALATVLSTLREPTASASRNHLGAVGYNASKCT